MTNFHLGAMFQIIERIIRIVGCVFKIQFQDFIRYIIFHHNPFEFPLHLNNFLVCCAAELNSL